MASFSILFSQGPVELAESPPDCFGDLHLDQLVASVLAGREEYELAPFFYTPLRTVEAIGYRHDLLRDLEDERLNERLRAFAEAMRLVRKRLALLPRHYHVLQRQRWFLAAARAYVDGVVALAEELQALEPRSAALRGFRQRLDDYVRSPRFTPLDGDERTVQQQLADICYCVEISGSRVTVGRYEDEVDYGAEVAATFAKFRQGDVKDRRMSFRDDLQMNHVEATVLERVARLHPDAFSALASFCERHRDFLDDDVAAFDRELQFAFAWLALVARLGKAGLSFCYPRVSGDSKAESATDTFDVALADQRTPVVVNDFVLDGGERMLVVSGPNQGGKTTFARTFGQLHHLAALGLPVPGTAAELFLCDGVFTHFEREETLTDLSGKLEDDLQRMRDLLERNTPSSVVILNEIFSSTTLADAILLGTRVLEQLIARDVLCVCVTFVDELAALDASVVSMVSTVDAHDPAVRTFKLVRRQADGVAHAIAIAEKYALTYAWLKERLVA